MKLLLMLLLVLAVDEDTKVRKPSSIAPSLSELTKEEEAAIEDIIDRFIRADTGRIKGADARKALQDFEALKPEAIPALIRALNRAARENQTCPVLTITKKLTKLLLASDDEKLLEFARDEIGADTEKSKYAGTLKQLRFQVSTRMNAIANAKSTKKPVPKTLAQLTTSELAKSAGRERGEKLEGIVRELSKRDGKETLAALALPAGSDSEAEVQKLARNGIDSVLGRASATAITAYLEDDNLEVRKGAIRVVAAKHPKLTAKVIDRIDDKDAGTRAEARAALVALSKGQDFGPEPDATEGQRREAKAKWADWWAKRR